MEAIVFTVWMIVTAPDSTTTRVEWPAGFTDCIAESKAKNLSGDGNSYSCEMEVVDLNAGQ